MSFRINSSTLASAAPVECAAGLTLFDVNSLLDVRQAADLLGVSETWCVAISGNCPQ
jgi:hypothetical protein